MSFFKLLRKAEKYADVKANQEFDQHADAKVQLEQAIEEAEAQHHKLRDQAAQVIANSKAAEMRLHHAMDAQAKAEQQAKTALLMADKASKSGDATSADKYTRAAQTFAMQLSSASTQVEECKAMLGAASDAAAKAKQAVADNELQLREAMQKRIQIDNKLDAARMQDGINKTMDQLNGNIHDSVIPTLASVEAKVDAQYAKAVGVDELNENSEAHAELEIAHASMEADADDRLSKLRAELGLGSTPELTPPDAA